MPQLGPILETALYVADLARSEAFYRDLFGLKVLLADERMRALRVGTDSVLLLFARGKSVDGADTPRGHIPGHDGSGRLHMAFSIQESDAERWKQTLAARNVELISEICPEQGGISLYFHDPDGHVIELATPSIWNL